ncbi:MAG: GTP pyrophosphokinase family protein, partial [Enterococcus faecium]
RGKSDDVYYRTLLKKESEREEAGDESSDRSQ